MACAAAFLILTTANSRRMSISIMNMFIYIKNLSMFFVALIFLLASALITVQAYAQTLNFEFEPTTSLYGQSSLTFPSGDYTLTVSASSVSSSTNALVAEQVGMGLGVKSDGSSPWLITDDETLHFSLSDSSGAVEFSNIGFKTAFSAHLFPNETATLGINNTSYELNGGARGADNASAILIDSGNAIAASWASELATSFSLAPGNKNVNGTVSSSDYRVIGLSVDLGATTAPVETLQARTVNQVIAGQTVQREYWVRYPQALSQSSYPIVFFFHGAGGQGLNMLNPPLENLIDRDEFIAVFPSGYNNRWNVSGESDADDIEFFQLMLNSFNGDALFDQSKVFAIGRSNGAGMSNKLAKETSLLNGIGPIVSQQLDFLGAIDTPAPVSVFQVNGDADTVIPIEGGYVGFIGATFLSAQASAENWASNVNCSPTASSDTQQWGNLTVQAYTFAGCDENRQVRYHAVEGAGHSMSLGGGYDLYETIWAFFKAEETAVSQTDEEESIPVLGSLGLPALALVMLSLGMQQIRQK